MNKAFTSQSSIERFKESKNSIIDYSSRDIDSRAKMLHMRLMDVLNDEMYDLGHVYKIIRCAARFSDYEILSAAEYCSRKANNPGKAFVGLFEKKIANRV